MNITHKSINENLYTFRGKTFMSDAKTIGVLNYALALNRSNERYKLKEKKCQVKTT